MYRDLNQYHKSLPLFLEAKDLYEKRYENFENTQYVNSILTGLSDLYFRMEVLHKINTMVKNWIKDVSRQKVR